MYLWKLQKTNARNAEGIMRYELGKGLMANVCFVGTKVLADNLRVVGDVLQKY